MKLYEYGEMNQSRLMSVCRLNNLNHKGIVDNMVEQQMIEKKDERRGKKTVYKYAISEKGKNLLEDVLQKYENLFPRDEVVKISIS